MLVKEILLGIIGLSAGLIISGGLFAFIASLGVISDIADRTHTGNHILLYEDATIIGGSLGNLWSIYGLGIPGREVAQGIIGIFTGIFVGCWAMSLAETLNVFPVFIRRAKVVRYVPYIILSIAMGKGIASCIYFFLGW